MLKKIIFSSILLVGFFNSFPVIATWHFAKWQLETDVLPLRKILEDKHLSDKQKEYVITDMISKHNPQIQCSHAAFQYGNRNIERLIEQHNPIFTPPFGFKLFNFIPRLWNQIQLKVSNKPRLWFPSYNNFKYQAEKISETFMLDDVIPVCLAIGLCYKFLPRQKK